MNSLETAKLVAKALDDKKGLDIKILKIEDLTVIADYFVIATGTSNTHVRALAGEAEYLLEKEAGIKPLREEGYDSGSWILIDFNSVIVHVFQPSAREFYSLERLWADATPIDTEFLTEE
ncbi:MAG: ribosome silencing factor [Ruminococcaceae bacterium]|nr:ribosome silencing factor [Oscillospiraceae bacterium]